MEKNCYVLDLISNIKYLKVANNYKLKEISELSGIPYSTLRKILGGSTVDVKLSNLKNLANIFNVDIGQLLGERPFITPNYYIPVLYWTDINIKKNLIGNIDNAKYKIPVSFRAKNRLFGVLVEDDLIKHNVLIVESTNVFTNEDTALISIQQDKLLASRVSIINDDLFIEETPGMLKQINHKNYHSFGIKKEALETF